MIVTDFELFQFRLPLNTPLKIAKKNILTREGLIFKIADDNKNIGLGEISPLPGLHYHSLIQTIEQIKNIAPQILGKEISKNLTEFNGQFDVLLNKYKLYPSVRFGVEMAVISLLAANKSKSIINLFTASPINSIMINALLAGSPEQIIEKVHHYLKEGFAVFKLKVGRNTIEEDIRLVNKINSIIRDKSLLRLDANQAWSLEKALHFVQNIDHKNIEYIEEPLKNFDELEILFEKTKIPIALDENILRISSNSFMPFCWLKAIVIKPTVIGGVEKSIQFIRYAIKNGIKPIISDTYQSGVGLSFLIAIATTVNNKNIAMGFDTYSWLKTDILNLRLNFSRGIIDIKKIPDIIGTPDYSRLKKI